MDAKGCPDEEGGPLPQNRFIIAILSTLIVSGCAAAARYEASRTNEVKRTEATLSEAGFKTVEIDTSEQVGLAKDLQPYEVRSYAAQTGTVYWYYDPDICSCVYEGHQDEFDQYKMLLRQRNDTAQYAAESERDEASSLCSLNPTFFPAPVVGFVGTHPIARGRGHGGLHRGGHGGGGHGR